MKIQETKNTSQKFVIKVILEKLVSRFMNNKVSKLSFIPIPFQYTCQVSRFNTKFKTLGFQTSTRIFEIQPKYCWVQNQRFFIHPEFDFPYFDVGIPKEYNMYVCLSFYSTDELTLGQSWSLIKIKEQRSYVASVIHKRC